VELYLYFRHTPSWRGQVELYRFTVCSLGLISDLKMSNKRIYESLLARNRSVMSAVLVSQSAVLGLNVGRSTFIEVREKTNKMQQLDVYFQQFLNMFRASLCPSSEEQIVCYCMWCAALVLLDVVGSGCGALPCGVRAL